MEPPIQTEYLRSGGATTLTFMLLGARLVISLVMRSAMPGNMVVPGRMHAPCRQSLMLAALVIEIMQPGVADESAALMRLRMALHSYQVPRGRESSAQRSDRLCSAQKDGMRQPVCAQRNQLAMDAPQPSKCSCHFLTLDS